MPSLNEDEALPLSTSEAHPGCICPLHPMILIQVYFF